MESSPKRMDKLELLAEIEGYPDSMTLLEENAIDSVVPGICVNDDCEYSEGVEPDQDAGWCEECQTGSVKSCLILAEVI